MYLEEEGSRGKQQLVRWLWPAACLYAAGAHEMHVCWGRADKGKEGRRCNQVGAGAHHVGHLPSVKREDPG